MESNVDTGASMQMDTVNEVTQDGNDIHVTEKKNTRRKPRTRKTSTKGIGKRKIAARKSTSRKTDAPVPDADNYGSNDVINLSPTEVSPVQSNSTSTTAVPVGTDDTVTGDNESNAVTVIGNDDASTVGSTLVSDHGATDGTTEASWTSDAASDDAQEDDCTEPSIEDILVTMKADLTKQGYATVQGDSFKLIETIVNNVENPIIVTDPPFNVGYHYKSYKDRKPEDEYWAQLASMCSLCPSVVIHYPESIIRLAIELGETPEREMAWVYNSNTKRQHRDIAFWRVKPDFGRVRIPYKNMTDKRVKKLYERTGGREMMDWLYVNQVKNVSKEKTAHPCQMPVEVMDKLVRLLPDGTTVIDPFMGSGTTGVACVRHGIRFVGIELDPEYKSISDSRIADERNGVGHSLLGASDSDGTIDWSRFDADQRNKPDGDGMVGVNGSKSDTIGDNPVKDERSRKRRKTVTEDVPLF